MKTKIFLVAFLTACHALSLFSQDKHISDIVNYSKDYYDIVEEAELYFQKKYPNLKRNELVSGTHRDGEYVKFLRWKNQWKYYVDSKGKFSKIHSISKDARLKKTTKSTNPFATNQWNNISHSTYIINQIGLGRTTSIGFHPTDKDIFYVGTANGGIWKTEDGGQTYIPMGDDLPSLSVSSIIVDRNNPSTIYIAISDHVWYGPSALGIYKSMDSGQSWMPTNISYQLFENIRIYHIEADPNDPDIMLVATENGVYRTTDGFQTSSLVFNSGGYHIKYSPGSSSLVYMTTPSGNFYKSNNGGINWSFIQNMGSSEANIAVSNLNLQKVYISCGTSLFKSTNQGLSFTSSNLNENHINQKIIFSPQDENKVFYGFFELWSMNQPSNSTQKLTDWLGQGGLYHMHVDMRNVLVNPLENDKIYWCNDGGIYRQNVNTNQFENLSNGLQITQFYDIAVSQTNSNLVSGGSQDNGSMYRNTNGNWDDFAPTGDGMNTEIDPTNANIRYWEYQNGSMYRWQSGFNTAISPPGKEGLGSWETPYRLDETNPSRLIAGYDVVYESLDMGNNWNAISSQLASGLNLDHVAISPSNPDRLYASSGNIFYAKAIGSNNWQTYNTPVPGIITDIEVDLNDENTVYITSSAYSAGQKIYKSTDGGTSWTNISGSLPNIVVFCIERYNDEVGGLFIGTNFGVYYRDDNLNDWFEYGELPHTEVRDIEIQYSNQIIRAGTHGRGVFESNINIIDCGPSDPDSDQDGVCDLFDVCPGFDDTMINQPCDDGDPLTSGEIYDVNCQCAGGILNINYCQAAGTPGTGADWISFVSLNTISNSSGQTSYSDFTNLTTELVQGNNYNILVNLNFSFPLDEIYAWIDYDKDGVFNNTNELLDFPDIVNQSSSLNFTVPNTSVTGLTKLRVRVIYADPNVPNPCGSFFGEVEDYAVDITNANCTLNTSCDDNDPCTINDVYDANCNCAGTFQDSDNDGICDANDTTTGNCTLNASCNDNDACTINDVYDANCNCVGTFQDSDNDGICDANDTTTGNCTLNTSCDDNDPCTINDVYDANCNCAGTFQDSDNDGICDANDTTTGNCTLNASCNDNDHCTINDVYDANCNCAGTFQDSDNDGICDANECELVSASTYASSNFPANTLDGRLNTAWTAQGDGQYIQYCLSSAININCINMAFLGGDIFSYTFDVAISSDGVSWTEVLTNVSSSGTTRALENFPFAPILAKKIKIIGHGNSASSWNNYTEVNWDCGPECEDLYIESNNPIIAEDANVNISIETNGTVPSGNSIKYNAGSDVLMNPGFEVKLGAVFEAFIEPCNI